MESFFQGWLQRQERLLEELVAAPRIHSDLHNPLLNQLIDRVLAHYQDYYQQKSRTAALDVLSVFSPSWLNPFERSFLWIGGWKPSIAFRLLHTAVLLLSPLQEQAVGDLQQETSAAERDLSEEMALVQEAMALPQVLGLVRSVRDGEVRDEAVEAVIAELKRLLAAADDLRGRTVNRLIKILVPIQTIDFLAAAAGFQLHIRDWGGRWATQA